MSCSSGSRRRDYGFLREGNLVVNGLLSGGRANLSLGKIHPKDGRTPYLPLSILSIHSVSIHSKLVISRQDKGKTLFLDAAVGSLEQLAPSHHLRSIPVRPLPVRLSIHAWLRTYLKASRYNNLQLYFVTINNIVILASGVVVISAFGSGVGISKRLFIPRMNNAWKQNDKSDEV